VAEKKENYHFFLVGIVSTVAMLALFLIVATFDTGTFLGRNLYGAATTDIVYDGQTYEVVYAGVGDTIALSNKQYPIYILDIMDTSAILESSFGIIPSQYTVELGSSVLVIDGTVVTLYNLSKNKAGFVLSEDGDACGAIDEQTPLCRGANACCGGSCEELPSCIGEPDGQVSSCGVRDLYCCDEQLSFVACGTQTACTNSLQCNDYNECTDEICDGNVCTNPDKSMGTPCADGICDSGVCVSNCTYNGLTYYPGSDHPMSGCQWCIDGTWEDKPEDTMCNDGLTPVGYDPTVVDYTTYGKCGTGGECIQPGACGLQGNCSYFNTCVEIGDIHPRDPNIHCSNIGWLSVDPTTPY